MSDFWKAALIALCAVGFAHAPALADEPVGEGAAVVTDEAAPRFVVLEANTAIPSTRRITGYELIDENSILIKTGATRIYLAELSGNCGRAARFGISIAIDRNGSSRVDTSGDVIVDGQRCSIESIALVERAPEVIATTAEQD